MTRVFVFTNHKGRVGKTTSATNTAFGIYGVSLIDRHSQAHATLATT